MPITDHTVSIRGQALHWYEAGHGVPVVLLHGGGGTGRAFWAQLEHLAGDHIRILAPDMPGFGQSEWFANVTRVSAIGAVLFDWLDSLHIDSLVIGGNSMGGRVALSMASHHPHRIQGLIILDSVGLEVPGVPVVNPLTLPASQYVAGLVYDPERYKRLTPYRTLDDARELNRGRRSFARYLEDGAVRSDPDVDLARLTMPALLIWGREDRIVPPAYGTALHAALANSDLLIIEQCGHLPHIEEPETTNRAIAHFLSREGLIPSD